MAQGNPPPFMDVRWTKDPVVIKAWGKFFAQMHELSKQFRKEYPQIVKRIQRWDQIHSGTLANTKLHPEDIAVKEDPQHYGVIHGDLNISNIHYVESENHLSVFDTDQVQTGFYLLDLAHSCLTIFLLKDGGIPIIAVPVEGLNCQLFVDLIVEGYQSESLNVNRQRLIGMIEIKKQACIEFARQAFNEGNNTAQIVTLLAYIRDHLLPKWQIET